jgi:subtilisin family serine protease
VSREPSPPDLGGQRVTTPSTSANVVADPLVAATWHLMRGSPRIDIGTATRAPSTDFDWDTSAPTRADPRRGERAGAPADPRARALRSRRCVDRERAGSPVSVVERLGPCDHGPVRRASPLFGSSLRLALALLATSCVDASAPDAGPAAVDAGTDSGSDAGPPLPTFACEREWTDAPLEAPTVQALAASSVATTPGSVALRRRVVSPNGRTRVPRGLSLVFFDPVERRALLRELAERGAAPVDRVARGAWIVRSRAPVDVPGLLGVSRLSAADRIDPRVISGMMVDVARLRDGRLVVTREAAPVSLDDVFLDDDVLSVEPSHRAEPLLDWQRRAVGADDTQLLTVLEGVPRYAGLSGRGIPIALSDTGVDATHPDFARYDALTVVGTRVEGVGPVDGAGHGTSVAGVMAGSGHASEGRFIAGEVGVPFQWRGIAPEVERIAAVDMNGDRFPLLAAFLDHGAWLSNESHTVSNGEYSARVGVIDEIIALGASEGDRAEPPRVVVFASANSGLSAASAGTTLRGYYSILAPPKNAITVGGSLASDDVHAPGASMGPTLDGRLKPDLVAPGYTDHRPPDGVELELFEVRIVAAAGSGATDIVWSPGTTDAAFRLDGAFASAPIDGGALRLRTFGSLDDAVVIEPPSPIDAAAYERVTVTMRLTVGGEPDRHRTPYFFVVRWPRTTRYPNFVERDEALHTHAMELSSDERWTGAIDSVRVVPVIYDDRVHTPSLGGGYGGSGGTSLAAPVVSGAIALLMERFTTNGVDFASAPLWPSTFKALLIHTAKDLVHAEAYPRDAPEPDTGLGVTYGPGPDWATGYGLLDIPRAVALADAHAASSRMLEETIEEGHVHVVRVPVDPDGGPLRVTLAWDDPRASSLLAPSVSRLVHDLDLIAIGPDGLARSPWSLNPPPLADDPFSGDDPITPEDLANATRCESASYWTEGTLACEDHSNNVEQVLVDAPTGGWWEIRVRAPELAIGPQRYSLVVTQRCAP